MENQENTNLIMKLVEFIKSSLKIGDNGKIENFFRRQIRKLESKITIGNKNIEAFKFQIEQVNLIFKDQIEDAEENLRNSYTDLDISQLTSNNTQDNYEEIYWLKIKRSEAKLDDIKNQQKREIEELNSKIEQTKENIAEIQSRIDTIKYFK